ncbi:GHKL domain-containing protein [Paraclostridium benzoelyticum]|uniref:GHKL domain-containing protein n=1 Tax=Paraclostridium benzoelyticum TaxID=1629550 RepID=UPI0031CD5543
MLKFTSYIILGLSILIQFVIFKALITYKKEGNKNQKIVFYILVSLIYIISIINGFKKYTISINYLIDAIVFIIWGIYFNYFYNVRYVKYVVLFYLFNVYYDLYEEVVYRILFIGFTGSSISSEQALLVSYGDGIKVQICSYIFIIFTFAILMFINKKLNLFNSEKRNYIYLLIALMANIINIVGRYTMGVYPIGNYYALSKLLFEWKMSVPVLQDEWPYFDQLVIPKLVIASSIIIIIIFRRTIKENKLKAQNELMQNKLDMQYKYYLSIQESHVKVKKLYHDINNHICCIDNLKNNSSEVDEYINNLKDEIKDFKCIYNTGNMILDIIINEKSKVCTNKDINFTCDINFSKVDFIKPIDVSSIFDNILDNAIEACDKISDAKIDKYIRIKGTVIKSFFIIKCENSKVNSVKIYKNILLTDKIDKFMHGIGIQSVKSSLEKYNGEILFEDEKNKFMINIYIPLNQNTDSWVD